MAMIPYYAKTAPVPVSATTTPTYKPFEITIHTLAAGTTAYIMGVGLSQIINKRSTWLKAKAIEPAGIPIKHIARMKPEERAHHLFFLPTEYHFDMLNHRGAFADMKDFDFSIFRQVLLCSYVGMGFCTTNSKIKSIADLKGKRIANSEPPKTGAMPYFFDRLLARYGITPENSRIEYMNFAAIANALRDGLIDAGRFGTTLMELPNKHVPTVYTLELIKTRDTYFLQIPKEDVLALRKEIGIRYEPFLIPAKMLGPKQTEDLWLVGKYTGWGAALDVPDHVITEVLRCVYEGYAEFGTLLPQGKIITPQTLATFDQPEERIHPAAVKFFKEKGIPITGFGVAK